MPLSPGNRIGPYEIHSPLGAGGMGEVYRARDTKLGRDVALKVLPAAVAQDAQRMARFAREAQVLASLNHPNIAAIYGLEEAHGLQALVMELVEGLTLADKIHVAQGQRSGPAAIRLEEPQPVSRRVTLQPDEVLPIAKQVAEALEAAHDRGIIHRDLKPANIKITPAGVVKVLDFGLAKAMDTSAPSDVGAQGLAPLQNSPTLSVAATQAGMILGTAAYMSPEQARGKPADRRADIWSFGCVLFEMLSGKEAFEGETVSDVLAGVIRAEADWSSLPSETPPTIARLIRRCLEKDPKRRLQAIGEARIVIEEILSGTGAAPPLLTEDGKREPRGGARSPLLQAVPWGVAAVAVLAAVIIAVLYVRRAPETGLATRSQISAPEKLKFAFVGPPTNGAPVLSPDGARMVFPAIEEQGREALYIRPMDSFAAQRLEGTEQGTFPFWSPDSRYVGFFTGGKLKKISVTGGPPQTLCDAPGGRGGTWNRDDVIVFAPDIGSGLFRVPAAGGTPSPVTQLQQTGAITSQRWPEFLPDGRHFLYWAGQPLSSDPSVLGVYVGSIDSTEQKLLVHADSAARYASPGYLFFLRESSLMAQAFDADRLTMKGDAFPVADIVAMPQNYRLGLFSVSQNGILVYVTGRDLLNQFTWFDATGRQIGTVGEPGLLESPALSPDGQRLAFDAQDPVSKKYDVWTMDLVRRVRTRFTFDPVFAGGPIWSPDGGRILFRGQQKGVLNFYVKNSSGVGDVQCFYESAGLKVPTDWSRDGRYLAFSQIESKTSRWGIWALPLFGDRKPFPFLQSSANEVGSAFSPDSHWLAYASDETGTFEVYLAPFPGGAGKFQVSQGGGVQPQWKRDGSSLFYLASAWMTEVSLRFKGSAVEIGTPRQLFQVPSLGSAGPNVHSYTVSPDAKKFLISVQPQASLPEPLTLVTNWTGGSKK